MGRPAWCCWKLRTVRPLESSVARSRRRSLVWGIDEKSAASDCRKSRTTCSRALVEGAVRVADSPVTDLIWPFAVRVSRALVSFRERSSLKLILSAAGAVVWFAERISKSAKAAGRFCAQEAVLKPINTAVIFGKFIVLSQYRRD